MEGTAGSKQISIRAYPSGPRAVIEVEDTGPGFGNLNRALDPFYTTKPVGKGTGLGLSVCYDSFQKIDIKLQPKLEQLEQTAPK